MNKIRISCASLASIKIDGKYLLCLNKSALAKGMQLYTPFGGAIEYNESALGFLNNLEVEFERKTPDLRLKTDKSNLDLFEIWFSKKKDREVGIERELIEEMVDEENIFNELNKSDFTSTYFDTIKINQQRNEYDSYHFFEIYNVEFSKSKIKEIYRSILLKDKLALCTEQDIINGEIDGRKISDHCKSILI